MVYAQHHHLFPSSHSYFSQEFYDAQFEFLHMGNLELSNLSFLSQTCQKHQGFISGVAWLTCSVAVTYFTSKTTSPYLLSSLNLFVFQNSLRSCFWKATTSLHCLLFIEWPFFRLSGSVSPVSPTWNHSADAHKHWVHLQVMSIIKSFPFPRSWRNKKGQVLAEKQRVWDRSILSYDQVSCEAGVWQESRVWDVSRHRQRMYLTSGCQTGGSEAVSWI